MQYDHRVLRSRSTPNKRSTLFSRRSRIRPSLVVSLVFGFLIERAYIYIYIDKRSHDDKSARVISKTLRSRALKLERFFPGKREHSRQSALLHHGLAKKEKDALEQKRIFNSHSTKAIVTCPSDFYVVIKL